MNRKSEELKEKQISEVMASIENRVRHAYNQGFEQGLIASKQEGCDDAISREWLKTAIHKFFYGLKHIPTEEDIQAYIDVAPRVTPQQKTGHWVLTDDDFVYCSECEDSYYPRPIDASWYYCPHCGARLEE